MNMQPYNYSRVNNGIIWVQGLEGAKAYPMMPNSNAILMDQESEIFYVKTCDSMGMCNLRRFKFEEINETKDEYITKSQLEEILRGLKDEQSISTNESESNE